MSTLVDLLTFFFLWRIWVICASLLVAPSKNSAPKTQSAKPFLVKYGFEVAQLTVRPKLHLSRESRGSSPQSSTKPWFLRCPCPSRGGNDQVYPEPKARWSKNFALPDRSRSSYPTLCDAQFQLQGLPQLPPALHLFSTKCNNVSFHPGYYTSFTLPRSCGRPPTNVNG